LENKSESISGPKLLLPSWPTAAMRGGLRPGWPARGPRCLLTGLAGHRCGGPSELGQRPAWRPDGAGARSATRVRQGALSRRAVLAGGGGTREAATSRGVRSSGEVALRGGRRLRGLTGAASGVDDEAAARTAGSEYVEAPARRCPAVGEKG
jgi:hypothetical protein